MPVQPTYPGVYIEELPSGVRTITGVATSITGLIGKALRGPTDQPVTITSFADFERIFGGLHRDMMMSYAVRDFFSQRRRAGRDRTSVQSHGRQCQQGDL